jgi:hypothetical protein
VHVHDNVASDVLFCSHLIAWCMGLMLLYALQRIAAGRFSIEAFKADGVPEGYFDTVRSDSSDLQAAIRC